MEKLAITTALRSLMASWRKDGQRIAFVPTMGNLHRGHLSLVERARQEADRVIVSIFVNPLQFGPSEDFARYPRTIEQDFAALQSVGTDAVYTPSVPEIYPRDLATMTFVEVPGLSSILCGAFRPGHFRGVATVVNKLFNLVQPDTAIFGEKDFQQVLVIRRMVEDLAMPVTIISATTTREQDGLAMSSRNGYLSAEQRHIAPRLFATLKDIRDRIVRGEGDFTAMEADGIEALTATGFRPDYLSIRRAADLESPEPGQADLVVLAAAYLGTTRLIDNVRV